jgi:hypothetical protein
MTLELYREGKYNLNGSKFSDKEEDQSYYMGELMGNMRHGRGYEMDSGEMVNNGFWFLDSLVDLSLFEEKELSNMSIKNKVP